MDSRYEKIKDFYKSSLGAVVPVLVKEGIHTNVFSFTVLFLCIIFTFFTLAESLPQAAAIGLLVAVCDITGSLIAEELKDKQKTKNALLDSILDRYSEIIFYTAILVYCLQVERTITGLFVFLALVGSSMSSFIRIRGEQFGIDLDWGFIRRPERIILLSLGMFFGLIGLLISSIIVATVSNATAIYFVWHIWFQKTNK